MTGTPTAPADSTAVELVRSIAATHSGDEGPLMVVLHDVQRHFGYVDAAWVPVIADELNLSRAEVHGVVSFYHDFRSEPAGLTSVKVCRAEACDYACLTAAIFRCFVRSAVAGRAMESGFNRHIEA